MSRAVPPSVPELILTFFGSNSNSSDDLTEKCLVSANGSHLSSQSTRFLAHELRICNDLTSNSPATAETQNQQVDRERKGRGTTRGNGNDQS